MGFFGLGRSPIKDKDPRARERALRGLPTAEQGTFIELALSDPDAGVRMAAAGRVQEPEFLAHLSKHKDPAIAQLGRERLAAVAVERLKQAGPAAAPALLEQVKEQNALVGVATSAEHPEVRRLAAERLIALPDASEAMLTRLAVQDVSGELGQRVLPRLGKRQYLKDLSRKAKSETLRAAAERRLAEIDAELKRPSREQRRRERAAALAGVVEEARTLVDSAELASGDAAFAELLARVEAIVAGDPDLPDDHASREARSAVERARGQFLRRREEQLPKRPEEVVADGHQAAEEAEDVQASDAAAPVAEEPVPSAEAERAEALIAEMAALSAREDLREAEQRAFELDKAWRVELAAIGTQHPLRQRFIAGWQDLKDARRQRRERRAVEAEQQQERLAALVGEAEALAAQEPSSDELAARAAAVKDLRARRKALGRVGGKRGGDLHRAFKAACDQAWEPVQAAHQERDWERFAHASQAEELIAAAAELAADEERELAELLTAIKDVQGRWKELGPVPRDKRDELWQAFKGHCDVVYERLQPLFAERDAERAANLAAKQAMIVEVEELAQPTSVGLAGSQAERDAAQRRFERVKELQEQWKATGPVPRSEDRELFRRWKAALDAFYATRRELQQVEDEERIENLNRKLALCVEAQELAEDFERFLAGTPVGSKQELDFLRGIKAIQRRFREIGHVPRDRYQDLRERFKVACDRVYDGLEPWFAQQDEERQANLERKRALLAELEELLEEERPDWFGEDVDRIAEAWRAAGPVPRAEREIEDRFHDLRREILAPRE